MTDRPKTTKNLRRALTILLAFGTLAGLSAAPAMAAPTEDLDPTFTIDINVTDTTCVPDYTDPYWGPYLDIAGMQQQVDLADDPSPVTFEVTLAFFAGMDNNACGLGDQPPSGDVYATLSLPAGLELGSLDCDLTVVPCGAETLFDVGDTGKIAGSINVADDAVPALYTATLQVVWTPE